MRPWVQFLSLICEATAFTGAFVVYKLLCGISKVLFGVMSMFYVSTESVIDRSTRRQRGGPAEHMVAIRDTNDALFGLCAHWRDLPQVLLDDGIEVSSVAGLFRCGVESLFVTPVSEVELHMFGLLSNPHYYDRPKLLSEFASSYYLQGWYNLAEANGACSVASLLLNKCDLPVNTFGGSIEVGSASVAICVRDEGTHAKYVRFDLKSYDALQRLRTKYISFNMQKTLCKSVQIQWREPM